MITVTCWPKHNRITVRGHAHSGVYGNDAVCAAASVLAYTLADNLKALGRQGKLKAPVLRLEPGDARISCRSREPEVAAVFAAICRGYRLLSATCPEQVKVILR